MTLEDQSIYGQLERYIADVERCMPNERAMLERAKKSYHNDTYKERACDKCGTMYQGPAVYCSLKCAVDDSGVMHLLDLT
jgi:hypothetical protein